MSPGHVGCVESVGIVSRQYGSASAVLWSPYRYRYTRTTGCRLGAAQKKRRGRKRADASRTRSTTGGPQRRMHRHSSHIPVFSTLTGVYAMRLRRDDPLATSATRRGSCQSTSATDDTFHIVCSLPRSLPTTRVSVCMRRIKHAATTRILSSIVLFWHTSQAVLPTCS